MSTASPPKLGRPPKSAGQRKSKPLNIRLSPSEYRGLLAYRDSLGVTSLPPGTAGRDGLVKFLQDRGFLPDK